MHLRSHRQAHRRANRRHSASAAQSVPHTPRRHRAAAASRPAERTALATPSHCRSKPSSPLLLPPPPSPPISANTHRLWLTIPVARRKLAQALLGPSLRAGTRAVAVQSATRPAPPHSSAPLLPAGRPSEKRTRGRAGAGARRRRPATPAGRSLARRTAARRDCRPLAGNSWSGRARPGGFYYRFVPAGWLSSRGTAVPRLWG